MAEQNDKPYPLKLREIKPALQQEAVAQNRSLHNLILTILKEWLKGRGIQEEEDDIDRAWSDVGTTWIEDEIAAMTARANNAFQKQAKPAKVQVAKKWVLKDL